MKTLTQSTIKRYFQGENFMTPNVIEYGQIDYNRFYELSVGEGLTGKPLYGVTVVRVCYGRPVERLHDQSDCFGVEFDARLHIAELNPVKEG